MIEWIPFEIIIITMHLIVGRMTKRPNDQTTKRPNDQNENQHLLAKQYSFDVFHELDGFISSNEVKVQSTTHNLLITNYHPVYNHT